MNLTSDQQHLLLSATHSAFGTEILQTKWSMFSNQKSSGGSYGSVLSRVHVLRACARTLAPGCRGCRRLLRVVCCWAQKSRQAENTPSPTQYIMNRPHHAFGAPDLLLPGAAQSRGGVVFPSVVAVTDDGGATGDDDNTTTEDNSLPR